MNTQSRRYLFIDFNNLLQVKFKKLEKVASRIFVFVEAGQNGLPFGLVQQTQRLGNKLRWIAVSNPEGENLNYQMAFVMGKFHQKLERDVEFAVISHDTDFDALVNFINASGRSCIRVKHRKEKPVVFDAKATNMVSVIDQGPDISFDYDSTEKILNTDFEDEIIAQTAEETIKRLIRSGNRPAEVTALKNYILLHNQEFSLHGNIDRIIQKMKETNDIEIRKGEVIYNF